MSLHRKCCCGSYVLTPCCSGTPILYANDASIFEPIIGKAIVSSGVAYRISKSSKPHATTFTGVIAGAFNTCDLARASLPATDVKCDGGGDGGGDCTTASFKLTSCCGGRTYYANDVNIFLPLVGLVITTPDESAFYITRHGSCLPTTFFGSVAGVFADCIAALASLGLPPGTVTRPPFLNIYHVEADFYFEGSFVKHVSLDLGWSGFQNGWYVDTVGADILIKIIGCKSWFMFARSSGIYGVGHGSLGYPVKSADLTTPVGTWDDSPDGNVRNVVVS